MPTMNHEDYKKIYEEISIHVEIMATERMRTHAFSDAKHHDLSFQILRFLSGYDKALEELEKLKGKKEQSAISIY